jgi:hypothetical protein
MRAAPTPCTAPPANRAGYLAMILVTLIAVAGCGIGRSPIRRPVDEKTMTTLQVTSRIEQIIRDTVAGLNPKPQLKVIDYLSHPTTCIDPSDGGSPDRAVLTRHYRLSGIPNDRNGDIGRQVKTQWERKGYKINSADRLETNEPQITGHTQPDEFSISLTTNADGALAIGSTSPCFWPNGTPEPSS